MDLSNLSTSDKLIGIGGIITIISLFLNWYGVPTVEFMGETLGIDASASLMDRNLGVLILILAAVAVAVVVLRVLEVFDMADQGLPEGTVMLVVGGLVGLFTVWAVLDTDGLDREWGMWVGVAAVVVFIAGTVMSFQEERA